MQFTTRESRIYLQSWKSSVSYLSCAYSVLGLYLAHVWTGHINMMTDESYWCWCQSYYLMFQDAASVYTLESDMKSNILAWIDCQWKKQIWIKMEHKYYRHKYAYEPKQISKQLELVLLDTSLFSCSLLFSFPKVCHPSSWISLTQSIHTHPGPMLAA